MVLDRELTFFESQKNVLLQHNRGQFALIHGDELLGTFTTFNEAFEAGVGRLGNQPFLITPITEQPTEVQLPALVVGVISAHL
jgi:hypothetical protein